MGLQKSILAYRRRKLSSTFNVEVKKEFVHQLELTYEIKCRISENNGHHVCKIGNPLQRER